VKLSVVAVGKIRERELRAVADEYVGRIRRYVRFEEIEVQNDAALARALPDGATIVALDPKGDSLTSTAFAKKLESYGRRGKGDVTFVLGGAEGIPETLVRSADARLSLSSLTLPHRLARVVLFEQIYRAFTILRGEPYPREG
jgi:23S rRNA (pseudouridine1915-N3)-methyltransferase